MWDAIVIGAGISGCSVARELSRYDLKVLVLEKGQVAAQGPADNVFESGVPARVFGVQSQALTVNGRKEYLFTQGEAKASPSGKNP